MKDKQIILLTVLTIGVLALEIYGDAIQADLRENPIKHEEIVTDEIKTSEKATERATEVFEVKTTDEPSEVTVLRLKKTAEEKTEETTGEIDENGYGWVQLQYSATYHITENHLTRSNGVVYFMGHRETWYSIHEPGQDVTAREIPGKHIADDGTIRDKDGYVCVASSDLPFYTIVLTSVGIGKVYDCGCSHGTIDVYTDW